MAEITPEEIALERIRDAERTGATELDLHGLGLKILPSEIGQLKKLKKLNISENYLENLPPEIGDASDLMVINARANEISGLPVEIGKLTRLTSLDLGFNNLTSLPSTTKQLGSLTDLNLTRNHFSDLLPAVGELTNLKTLCLGGNNLKHFPQAVTNLLSLSELYLGPNEITILPREIGRLTNLKVIWANRNNLTTLPAEIGYLTKLETLDLSTNMLKTVPPEIGLLKNLTELDLSENRIATLPPQFAQLSRLMHLNLTNNLFQIPPEIIEKTKEPQAILNYYFSIVEQKERKINEIKFLTVGQGSVGKTSIIKRILYGTFDQNEAKTEGICIDQWKVDGIFINIWDFGGQEIMHATHQFFLTKRSLYLLVLDSRLTQEENRVEYWLKIIQSFGGESPVLLVGNKIDQHPLDIDRTGLKKKYPNIVGILETSAATGAGIEELKQAITEQVNNLPHVRDLLPENWFTVKTKLEELGRESNFINHDDYVQLCAENEVSDETSQRTLIGFLHDLGVVLHFQDDPRLEALGILNPQWVTNGVYKILNSHTLFQNKGVLTVAMLDEILNLPEYPRGKQLFIVDMMKKFELCYDIQPDKTFLVPDLLPKDELSTGNWDDTLAFLYEYPVLPSSVMTRFIVRINSHIEGNQVWRSGVVLKIGEPVSGRVNHALLRADLEDKKISINIGGPEHTRRDTLAIIRHQLDEIHASIKGLNPKRKIPVPGHPGIEPLDYEYLLELERDGIPILPFFDGQRNIKVDVKQLLNGIESEDVRRMTYVNISGTVGGSVVVGDDNSVMR